MRIAMVAPPWLPVPPSGYGGIETMIALLCEGLVNGGHDVTLFAAPGSKSSARVEPVLPSAHASEMSTAQHEADHVARVFEAIEVGSRNGSRYDVMHDHCGFTAFAMADRIDVPVVHTLHGPFTRETYDFYRHHAQKACAVAISRRQRAAAPPSLRITAVIPNPIDARAWPYEDHKDDYLLWLGRMTEVKGPHRAITVARDAGARLVLAGPVQPGEERFFATKVEPHIDNDAVRYVGEVGGDDKKRLFANARALLMPIRWDEPFGIVMVEAMVSGTPVIAFPEGAAADIVIDGRNGFLVDDEREMAHAVGRLGAIDPAACRDGVVDRYGVERVSAAYESVYAGSSRRGAPRRRAFAFSRPPGAARAG
jgi:glycosyltransferase involved in cell wall biosynthesis